MAYAKGEVVLVPFPFTDLAATRVRPAVVVSSDPYNRTGDDLIVAMVTSQPHAGPTDCALRNWREAGLLYPSWVRAKLATLEQRLVQFSPGRLSARDTRTVDTRLRRALGLSGS
ncbi:MAG: type II toxin-antitoxin system PemK/MazF family toxin [Dehalococcoidia bacterium]|nr:type II toxin-antitoxin system PemK/MazF family toxin [Dehalococcoidia bacterium]